MIAVRCSFLSLYFDDLGSGTPRRLEEYLREFPGFEDEIADEFASVEALRVSTRLRIDPSPPPGIDAREFVVETESSDPLEGEKSTGPFRLLERIGSGGMGIVYRAEQRQPVRRIVALKVLRFGFEDRDARLRFDAERQALAWLSHPNIARIYESGTTPEGEPYFAMELIDGRPVLDHADDRRLPIESRLRIFVRVCEAVEHAHRRGILHRDLKPSNILVENGDGTSEPVPKIIDFGIAKSVAHPLTPEVLETGSVLLGTPAYMSPEQALGDSAEIDTRTDVWALGVVLFELLVGERPFDDSRQRGARAHSDLLLRIAATDAPSLIERFRRLPADEQALVAEQRGTNVVALERALAGDVAWIVARAIERSKSRRYASVADLRADLERYLGNEPIEARPPSILYRAGKFAIRRRMAILRTAALIFTAIAAVMFVRYREVREREDASAGELGLAREEERTSDTKRAEIAALSESIARLRAETPTESPVWLRDEEIRAVDEMEALTAAAETSAARAQSRLQRARDLAPEGSDERRKAEAALVEHHRRTADAAHLDGGLRYSLAFFQARAESTGADFIAAPERPIRFLLQTKPPGAKVFVFRYERHAERLLPLAWSPAARRTVGAPSLQIERLWRANSSDPKALIYPFQTGDRILRCGGVTIQTEGDLDRLLAATALDALLYVDIARNGETLRDIPWTPFPSYKQWTDKQLAGRVFLPSYLETLYTYEPAPLEFSDSNLLGEVGENGLGVDLPPGSYLLVLRATDRPDVRFPVASPWNAGSVRVELPPEDGYPTLGVNAVQRWILVPAGPTRVGGDPEVDQALPAAEPWVDSFYIQRYEVRIGEYIAFLDDPGNELEIDAGGRAPPRAEWPEWMQRDYGNRRSAPIALVPVDRFQTPILIRDPATGNWAPRSRDDPSKVDPRISSEPLRGISLVAALEFIRWWNLRPAASGWRFRLPSDVEWEKAARGVDGRACVWGARPYWSFACAGLAVGKDDFYGALNWFAFPTDESVYGVRNLAGSVSEFTSGDLSRFWMVLRGGNFGDGTLYYLRAANRNGGSPVDPIYYSGFRLVAERR
jgi:serine/threonine protein kinase/formylglycine-generating enzyme required for sulfatase activity